MIAIDTVIFAYPEKIKPHNNSIGSIDLAHSSRGNVLSVFIGKTSKPGVEMKAFDFYFYLLLFVFQSFEK